MTCYGGGCHCGAVRFEVDLSEAPEVHRCNCSMCSMLGYEHLIVPAANFRLLQGESALTTYTFNTGVAQHRFCRHCGIKSFYVPRSNPDGFSVNLRCLDTQPDNLTFYDFDGQHWEQHAHSLTHLSQ
ncbi:MAG: GFA family protein [Pseudomonadota bacterium]